MKPGMVFLLVLTSAVLGGCLEVEQHPAWRDGHYDGKADNLPQQRNFHNDRMAWMATVINRNWHQDEYLRTGDRGADYD
jgi:hypothetical protein